MESLLPYDDPVFDTSILLPPMTHINICESSEEIAGDNIPEDAPLKMQILPLEMLVDTIMSLLATIMVDLVSSLFVFIGSCVQLFFSKNSFFFSWDLWLDLFIFHF